MSRISIFSINEMPLKHLLMLLLQQNQLCAQYNAANRQFPNKTRFSTIIHFLFPDDFHPRIV